MSFTQKDLEELRVVDLKDLLRQHQLKVGGNKSALIERLLSHFQTTTISQTPSQFVPPTSMAQFVPPTSVAQFIPPTSMAQFIPPTSMAQFQFVAPVPVSKEEKGSLLALIKDNPKLRSWAPIFSKLEPELKLIDQKLQQDEKKYGPAYPKKEHIFRAFELTPLEQVKVVILGQDPYHQTLKSRGEREPRAQGLAFSVSSEDKIPMSLWVIFQELQRSIPGFEPPKSGDLTSWAQQGVLLLNADLTVRPGEANSHKGWWKPWIQGVLLELSKEGARGSQPPIIFVLWGRNAQVLAKNINSPNILKSDHPAAERGNFIGNNHFVQINEILRKEGREPINWKLV